MNNQFKIELPDLIGPSEVMPELKESVVKVAPSDSPIMIAGKSGVGKENLARAKRKLSNRKLAGDSPCCRVCAGLRREEL